MLKHVWTINIIKIEKKCWNINHINVSLMLGYVNEFSKKITVADLVYKRSMYY
jgi:hypothetical protein